MSTPLWLASTSARRRQLLDASSIEYDVMPPGIDDGVLVWTGVPPCAWVMALSWLKARHVSEQLEQRGVQAGIVLAADTVCVHDDEVIGQPDHGDDARTMIRRMRGTAHITMTGVAMHSIRSGARLITCDMTRVQVGWIDDDAIERYVASGDWRGKAGGYNLSERLDDGWPIDVDGDPTTVMGLPMRRLPVWLQRLEMSDETERR